MEVIDLLKEDIKKLVLEDNINISKLNEYTRIYERLRAFDVTTVQQVGVELNEPYYPIPRMNMNVGVGMAPPIANEIGVIFDMLKEVAYDINKPKGRSEIEEYIWWLDFLKNLKKDVKKYPMTDRLNELWDREIDCLIYKLYERTIGLMKKQLTENIEKETKELEKREKNKGV